MGSGRGSRVHVSVTSLVSSIIRLVIDVGLIRSSDDNGALVVPPPLAGLPGDTGTNGTVPGGTLPGATGGGSPNAGTIVGILIGILAALVSDIISPAFSSTASSDIEF